MCVWILFTCIDTHTHPTLTRNEKAYCRISPKIQLPIFFFACSFAYLFCQCAIAATATRVCYSGHTMPCSTKCTHTHTHICVHRTNITCLCAARISVWYLLIFRFLVYLVVFSCHTVLLLIWCFALVEMLSICFLCVWGFFFFFLSGRVFCWLRSSCNSIWLIQ